MKSVKIAACQAQPRFCTNKKEFIAALEPIFKEAKAQQAFLLVLPEDIGFWIPKNSTIIKLHNFLGKWIHEKENKQPLTLGVKSTESSNSVISVTNRGSFWNSITNLLMSLLKTLNLRWLGDLWEDNLSTKVIHESISYLAGKYKIFTVGGSTYERILDKKMEVLFNGKDLYNVSYMFNTDGAIMGFDAKRQPIEVELAAGVTPYAGPPKVFNCDGIKVGISICNDINFDWIANWYKELGVNILTVPSAGWVPSFEYPYDINEDLLNANVARSKETGLVIARSYQAGELLGLHFRGHACISNRDGILVMSGADQLHTPLVLTTTVNINV